MRTDMLQQLEGVVRRAGDIVREAHDIERATMEKHGAADLVTKYDVAVQGFLQRELLALLPEADFLGEEGDHTTLTRPWTFIVDPIDGTTNFVRGFAYTNISVALANAGTEPTITMTVNGKTVDVNMGAETAYVYIAGKKYELKGDTLVEPEV